MTKPVILTGLRANNDLTLGNYFGGILPIVDMAKTHSADYQINMFIPDLHSFTTPIDHSALYDQILHNARLFVAAGLPLNDNNIYLYRQSYVPAHSELTWILDCFTGFGEMSRMTQFKDKSQNFEKASPSEPGPMLALNTLLGGKSVTVGLFNYPVLMAADILLYNAKYIPVGDDQTQHLEFARDIAERINKRFGEIFIIPEPVSKQHQFFGKDQGLRIMDLQDPVRKMSKSDESGKGVIFLGDTPDTAAKKIMSATTDDKASVAYDPVSQPGVSNLLEILSLLRGQSIKQTEGQFAGESRYGEFKQVIAEETKQFIADFQANLANVDTDAVLAKLESSEAVMRDQANETLLRVQKAVGLRK